MSVSTEKADGRDGDGASTLAPNMTEVELETAFLRSVVDTRPVGPHKHFLVIQLQADLFRRTETLMPIEDIWRRIEGMFDVAALDRMASPESMPDSPRALSPLPKSSRHVHANSLSPLSTPSRSPSPSAKPSKSAQLINSSYFGTPFTLPYFRLNQNEWKSNGPSNESGKRQRSRSVASTSTHTDTEKGFMLNEDEIDIVGPELKTWHDTIYEGRPTEGVDQEAEEKEWTAAEKQIADRDEAEAQELAKLEKAKPKKRPGRPSKVRKEKEDTSELSDAAADALEEEEAETPKSGRAKRATAGKRKRDSAAKEESEDEKEVKETKPSRKRK